MSMSLNIIITLNFPFKANFKTVYTGDTRPCRQLQSLSRSMDGRRPDLVIHEATMPHIRQDDAIRKKHCTVTEAVRSARDMGARFTLLTHFSQRFSKMVPYTEFEGCDNVAAAFDHMEVTPRTFRDATLMAPAVQCIFDDYMRHLEARVLKPTVHNLFKSVYEEAHRKL